MITPLHRFQYVTNSSNLNDVVSCKVLHFIKNKDLEALGYKTLWCTNIVASHKENKSLNLYIHV